MVKLMTENDATFDGRFHRLQPASYRPRPVQQPHPPIWVGGGGERRTLPLAARRADVWNGFGSASELARKSRLLDRFAEEAGRDPAAIGRSTSLALSEPWDEVRRTADAHFSNGFTTLVAAWPSEGWSRVEQFAERLLPDLRARR